MIDTTTERGRIVDAAMALAATKPWSQTSLAEIATKAGVDLAGLRTHFSSKADIVAAFIRIVDDEVLKITPESEPSQAARDAVFEVIMNRFDALAPFREALRSIAADQGVDPALYGAVLNSQAWMLRAAGIDAEGLSGGVRAVGLASVYASVFRTWLDDDDAGLARTMAVLDRRLRRGERTLQTLDGIASTVGRVASFFLPSARPARSKDATPPANGVQSTNGSTAPGQM